MKPIHFAIATLFALTACLPDDVTDGAPLDTSEPVDTSDTSQDTSQDTEQSEEGIQGAWRSEGADLAPLLVDVFGFNQVDARFKGDGSYTVDAVADDGKTYAFAGTYTVGTGTTPHTIVLSQTSPSTATAEGIYRVQEGVLTYEVVQTQPDFGFTPPTPQSGFGSTQGEGIAPDSNVQVYRRP